jgi:hypothetical protein
LQKLGWMKKNGNGYAEIIENHEKRLEVANSEMGDVRELLVGITTKVDIIMRHLNL